MGDPRRSRKKFSTPSHPWQKERIESEKALIKEYGLKNKKEVWKAKTPLDHFTKRIKMIISTGGTEADEEARILLDKLVAQGLVKEGAKLGDVLSLTIKDILERRLQTLVFRKGMARTVTQARQFVTHGHITVNGTKISSPAYLATVAEEKTLAFMPKSSLASPEHPETARKEALSEKKKEQEQPAEAAK